MNDSGSTQREWLATESCDPGSRPTGYRREGHLTLSWELPRAGLALPRVEARRDSCAFEIDLTEHHRQQRRGYRCISSDGARLGASYLALHRRQGKESGSRLDERTSPYRPSQLRCRPDGGPPFLSRSFCDGLGGLPASTRAEHAPDFLNHLTDTGPWGCSRGPAIASRKLSMTKISPR